jgi:serine/threonine-protein kinase RsbW
LNATWTLLGSLTLPAVPESVARARRFTKQTLPAGDRTDTVVLLVSEAATNSVSHSRSPEFTVTLFAACGGVRAEVVDGGGPTVPTRRDAGALATSGRGVGLIEDLSDRSGHHRDDAGRLHVWFELD